jgi:threonyl-tRNA synthetase
MSEERKTLEQREQMTDLERLRHSASHVLATADFENLAGSQFAAGPPMENGFYYDVDVPHRISPDDFENIEAEMKKEIKANHSFEKIEVCGNLLNTRGLPATAGRLRMSRITESTSASVVRLV